MKKTAFNQKGFGIFFVAALTLIIAALVYLVLHGIFTGEGGVEDQIKSDITSVICQDFSLSPGVNETSSEQFCSGDAGYDVTGSLKDEIDKQFKDHCEFPFPKGWQVWCLNKKEDFAKGFTDFFLKNVTAGVGHFEANQVLRMECAQDDKKNWTANLKVPEKGNCAAQKQTCFKIDETNAECRGAPPEPAPQNPAGKFYTCNNDNKKCAENTCDLATIKTTAIPRLQEVCSKNLWDLKEPELTAQATILGLLPAQITQLTCLKPLCDVAKANGDITTVNLDSGCMGLVCQLMNGECNEQKFKDGTACGPAPPSTLKCDDSAIQTAGCAHDAQGNIIHSWELKCVPENGKNIPANRQACHDQGFDADPTTDGQQDITCDGKGKGVDFGYLCGSDSYCNNGSKTCVSIGAIACDNNPRFAPIVNTVALTSDTVPCGQVENGKHGLQCAQGQVCDVEHANGPSCVLVSDLLNRQNYAFNLADDAGSRKIALNAAPVSNTDFALPQVCIPSDQPSIFCPQCGGNPLTSGLSIRYNRLPSKGGTVHFQMVSQGVGGADNYAVIRYNDVQPGAGNRPKAVSEAFVAEVNAGAFGDCTLEGQDDFSDLAGETGDSQKGTSQKIFVNYTWDWTAIANDLDFCNKYACDSTQFLISLLARLKTMKDNFDSGDSAKIAAAHALQDFNVLLMADSITTDFRNDFNALYTQSTLFQAPDWYKTGDEAFYQFVAGDSALAHLVFDPQTVSTPGRYNIQIDLAGDTVFFNENHEPKITITMGVTPLTTSPALHMNHAVYLLPLDGAVGSFPQGNSRDGYGAGISLHSPNNNTTINRQGNQPLNMMEINGNHAGTTVYQLVDFDETENSSHRGRILDILYNPDGSILSFSPTVVTPVAIKIPAAPENNKRNMFYGTYYLSTGNAGVRAFPERSSFSVWTGVASTKASDSDPVCTDFEQEPLRLRVDDQSGAPLDSGVKGLGFTSGVDKFLVFATVFYTPTPGMLLVHTGDKTELMTPNGKLSSAGALSLNFSGRSPDPLVIPGFLPNGLKINSLQDVVNLFNQNVGAICVKTAVVPNGGTRTVFFWNRAKIIREVLDKRNTPFSPQYSNAASVLTDLTGMEPDFFCG